MSLASYSGMSAKIRAMQGRLFTKADYEALAAEPTVATAIAFCLEHPGYEHLLRDGDASLHRESLERAMRGTLFADYRKLRHFANREQDAFLKLYFTRYEAWVIKMALRYLLTGRSAFEPLFDRLPIFREEASFDTEALLRAATVQDAVAALRGTIFHEPLLYVSGNPDAPLFDYETALDIAHFVHVWKARDKVLSKEDRESLNASFGARIDLMNLQWLYRAMHFYHLSGSEARALLVPIRYKLRRGETERLSEGPEPSSFADLLAGTPYEKMIPLFSEGTSIHTEAVCSDFLGDLYKKAAEKHPYTAAVMNAYLYRKEAEGDAITTIIEGIRYGLPPSRCLANAFPVREERRYLS